MPCGNGTKVTNYASLRLQTHKLIDKALNLCALKFQTSSHNQASRPERLALLR
jgi:hypothetical protein